MFKYVPPEFIDAASKCLGRFSSPQKRIFTSVLIATLVSLFLPLIFPKLAKIERWGLIFVSLALLIWAVFGIFAHISCPGENF